MTQDTKQLMETQKNLMDMLKTFTPIVQEGRQMMDTFNGLFGPSAGAATKGGAAAISDAKYGLELL